MKIEEIDQTSSFNSKNKPFSYSKYKVKKEIEPIKKPLGGLGPNYDVGCIEA